MAKKRKQSRLEARVTEILGRHDLEGLMESWKHAARPNHYDVEARVILERAGSPSGTTAFLSFMAGVVAGVFNEYFHADDAQEEQEEGGFHDPKDAKIVACARDIALELNRDKAKP